MRAATFAAQIGKAVSFAQAAFRQAFAGGKDLTKIKDLLAASRTLVEKMLSSS